VFGDLIVGVETYVTDYGNFSRHIDKNGNAVTVHPEYWNDHPIWGGMIASKFSSPDGNPTPHDVVRLPGFYADAETLIDGKYTVHRAWISPVDFGNGRGYLHPAFRLSPSGIFMAGAVVNYSSPYTRSLYNVTGSSTTDLRAKVLSINGAETTKKVQPWNFHTRNAIMLLARIEHATIDASLISSGYGGDNTMSSFVYRNIRSLARTATNTYNNIYCEGIAFTMACNGNDQSLISKLGIPENPSSIMEVGTGNKLSDEAISTTLYTSEILTGFDDGIGAHLDLYFLPQKLSNVSGAFNKFLSPFYGFKNTAGNVELNSVFEDRYIAAGTDTSRSMGLSGNSANSGGLTT
jgi:hypothetical protein